MCKRCTHTAWETITMGMHDCPNPPLESKPAFKIRGEEIATAIWLEASFMTIASHEERGDWLRSLGHDIAWATNYTFCDGYCQE